MIFRYYTNAVSQATKGIAKIVFIIGLLLIGFAALILAMPEVFTALVAVIFIVAGIGCCITAGKIFWKNRQLQKMTPDETGSFRQNVQVHIDDYDE